MVTALGSCVKWPLENFGRASPRRVAMHAWCPRRKNKEPGEGTRNNVFAKQGTLMRIGKLGWVFPHAKNGEERGKNTKGICQRESSKAWVTHLVPTILHGVILSIFKLLS
jgi:hypothetical protein